MLNKKILAASIAASLTTSAYAVDFAATPVAEAPTIFASELVTFDDNGLVLVQDGSQLAPVPTDTADLSAEFRLGFTIGNGTSKYVRVNLTGGEFTGSSAPTLVLLGLIADPDPNDTDTTNDVGYTVSISQGGANGDDFVIFEIAAEGLDIEASQRVSFDSSEYEMGEALVVDAVTYETAADAVAEASPLASTSGTLAVVSNGTDGEFAIAGRQTATVESLFERFDASTAPVTTDTAGPVLLGQIAPEAVLLNTRTGVVPSYRTEGSRAVASDFYSDPQDVTISGDFTFGEFTLNTAADCSGTALTWEDDDATDGSITFENVAMGDYYFCVEAYDSLADTVNIEKGNYILDMEDGFTDVLGTIVYNTVTIEVPYLTTFSEYNQRVYLVNNGSRPADYSMSFVTEGDTEATPLAAASGTIPAGEMVVLRSADIVSLEGKTRTSAVIEVAATEANVTASTQTVNLETGTTDTVILNANSITAFEE